MSLAIVKTHIEKTSSHPTSGDVHVQQRQHLDFELFIEGFKVHWPETCLK
jgi:hypothetical protein